MESILIKDIDVLVESGVVKIHTNIVIEDGKFKYIGTKEELLNKGIDINEIKFDTVINGKNKFAMPGLVNAHSHAAMVLFRGFADDMSLENWLFNNILPAEAKLTGEDIYWGTSLAICEMIKSGTTAFADMYLQMDNVAKAVYESGIRANLAKDSLVQGKKENTKALDRESVLSYYQNWNNKDNGRIKVFLEIHSVYLYDEPALMEAAAFAKEIGTGVHIHILETLTEKKTSIDKYGINPVEESIKCGIFDVPAIAAHCVHLTDQDIERLKQYNVTAVHNPTSNLKLGSGIARIPDMLKAGVNVALGTDGAGSNNNLNMFEEMHLAGLLHKGYHMNAELIKADEVIKMATINGARALGFDNVGTINEGMAADLIMIDTDKPHLTPFNKPSSMIVYSAQASDVDTVIINGKLLMKERELLTIDEERMKFEVRRIVLK